ncbi:MAG: hypothetical protein R3320_02875 [Nitriliruptorales bacterium]|nr:hypothetical protein [Nitriliruptorales bacterium]
MTKRLIAHIGTHKTGSSAIQAVLSQAGEDLAQAGVLYPRSGQVNSGGHLNLCWQISEDPRFDAARGTVDDLVSEVRRSEAEVAVISAETLTSRPRNPIYAEFIADLAGRIFADEVLVVAYVRPQWEYLDSLYTQRVKRGYIDDTYVTFIEANHDQPRLDYVTTFDQWERGSGEALRLRPYDRASLRDGDVVADFLSTSGLERLDLGTATANPRPGARAVEALRLLHRRLAEQDVDPADHLALFQRVGSAVEERFPRDPPYRGMTYGLAEQLAEHYQPANSALVSHHRSLSHVFALPPPEEFPPASTWSLDTADPEECRAVLEIVESTVLAAISRGAVP